MICSFLVHFLYSSPIIDLLYLTFLAVFFEYDSCFHYNWFVVWHGDLVGCWFRISYFYRFTVSHKNTINLIAIWVLLKQFVLELITFLYGASDVHVVWCVGLCVTKFVIQRLCRLHSSTSFSPFSFISILVYFPMILLSNGSLLHNFVLKCIEMHWNHLPLWLKHFYWCCLWCQITIHKKFIFFLDL